MSQRVIRERNIITQKHTRLTLLIAGAMLYFNVIVDFHYVIIKKLKQMENVFNNIVYFIGILLGLRFIPIVSNMVVSAICQFHLNAARILKLVWNQ